MKLLALWRTVLGRLWLNKPGVAVLHRAGFALERLLKWPPEYLPMRLQGMAQQPMKPPWFHNDIVAVV